MDARASTACRSTPPSTVAYKGMMLTGVPNFAFAVGYTNASWTLKCDLVSRYVCRLLAHLQEQGYDVVTPVPPPDAGPRCRCST